MARKLSGVPDGAHAAAIRVVTSPSAAARLREAARFLDDVPAGREVFVVAASRGAADDLARTFALERGATAGVHRFSLAQLAARIAAMPLALRGTGPSSALGSEAVAARAAFETAKADALEYFTPVAAFPGFARALAATLREIRGALVPADVLVSAPRVGADLAALLEDFEAQFAAASAADRAELFGVATVEVHERRAFVAGQRMVLLDVPCDSPAERAFVRALVQSCSSALVTIPAGDDPAGAAFATSNPIEQLGEERSLESDLGCLRTHLFRDSQPPPRARGDGMKWFSAPGEGRECAEIARFILEEARAGIRFDEMAILLRSPQRYQGLLEHALSRAGIPAWFDRGTRRPHPAGRAFLALLACGVENLSAARFAEYLSLGQVPQLHRRERQAIPRALPDDELLAALTSRATGEGESGEHESPAASLPLDGADNASVESEPSNHRIASPPAREFERAGTVRAPWKWEQLLVESAVIGGADRWRRRLDGLDREYRMNFDTLRAKDPDDPKLARLERDIENLQHLRQFALPVIEQIASWPQTSTWGTWLERLTTLAQQVLRQQDDVVRVLADLRPMAEIGPVSLEEVARVLTPRLLAIETEAPRHRYGRVFVGSPHQARGRAFKVVFVPGLAERMFPQRLAEDPLLVDDIREQLDAELPVEGDRAATERLLLRLAVGAATNRLYASYPRLDSCEARERVPSFYALEMMRAATGTLPGPEELRRAAAAAIDALLSWPAPAQPELALDDFEHDLAVLAPLLKAPEITAVRGRARYLIHLSETLRRSVTSRWERWQAKWAPADGIIRVSDRVRDALVAQRLVSRPYSLSALQQFADCPYRFMLSAMHRLEPFEVPQPLQRLDPLTKGSLVHRIQAEFFRALQAQGDVPMKEERRGPILEVLESTVERVTAEAAEMLAPAIEKVWRDEVDAIGSDLREWTHRLISAGDEWDPELFEFGFGLPTSHRASVEREQRDPRSQPDPIKVNARFLLRGSVDLVERNRATREWRVTDHKTGRNRAEKDMVVGGGRVLQPVLYGLAVEAALGGRVVAGRLSYCTAAGGFTTHDVELTPDHRHEAIEVLEIIDRAIETGFLPAAPAERACAWCDFHAVCGPWEEKRTAIKHSVRLGDLKVLREKP